MLTHENINETNKYCLRDLLDFSNRCENCIIGYTSTGTAWTKKEIKALLEKSDTFVARSTVKIFERQTADEKINDGTSHNNGVGFNGSDAYIMSQFAKFYMEKNYLSVNQLKIARRKILKYAKQLTEIANEKAELVQP